jgi:hypothetical protein
VEVRVLNGKEALPKCLTVKKKSGRSFLHTDNHKVEMPFQLVWGCEAKTGRLSSWGKNTMVATSFSQTYVGCLSCDMKTY